MSDLETTVDTYLAAYNETDGPARLALVQQAFVPAGELIDPPIDGRGHDGISDTMATVQQQFPGHTFRRTSGVDQHHGYLRYEWELLAADGSVAIGGLDIGEVDDTGKLVRIVGFLGPVPDAA